MAHNIDETREQIVNAAREVFARYGYKKTTLDDIAGAVYKAKSSIYYYFRNKEEVFQAVIEKETEEINRRIALATRDIESPILQLKVYFSTALKAIGDTTNYYNLMLEDFYDILPFARTTKRRNRNNTLLFLNDILRRGIKNNDFDLKEEDIPEMADTLLFGIESMFSPFNDNPDWKDGSVRNRLFDLILFGLVKREKPVAI